MPQLRHNHQQIVQDEPEKAENKDGYEADFK